MPRRAVGLTAREIKSKPPGRYADGLGLILEVKADGRRYFAFRYMLHGRARLKGLGPADGRAAISLGEARRQALALHVMVRGGTDPLEAQDDERATAKAERAKAIARGKSFAEVMGLYIQAHAPGWSPKHRISWEQSMQNLALPRLGGLPVGDIDTAAVMAVIAPAWAATPETASRVRSRIEAVLDYAAASGWREGGDNPARWRGHLQNLLPKVSKVAPVVHHPALPWREISGFMRELEARPSMSALALRFTILTAARIGEVCGARWSEIDLEHAVWTVPASRMKSRVEHRVPLSDAALALLREVMPAKGVNGDAVFPGQRGPITGAAIWDLLNNQMGRKDLTAHGFRSTFRDWAGETGQPSDIAEAALAHAVGSKVQAAYQRGDLLQRRRALMDAWAAWCARPEQPAEVVRLRASA